MRTCYTIEDTPDWIRLTGVKRGNDLPMSTIRWLKTVVEKQPPKPKTEPVEFPFKVFANGKVLAFATMQLAFEHFGRNRTGSVQSLIRKNGYVSIRGIGIAWKGEPNSFVREIIEGKRELPTRGGHSHCAVVVKFEDGKEKKFPSVASACRFLNYSVSGTMNKRLEKSSVIKLKKLNALMYIDKGEK